MHGDGLFHRIELDDDDPFQLAGLVGFDRHPTSQEPAAGRLDRRYRELSVGREFRGVRELAVAGNEITLDRKSVV